MLAACLGVGMMSASGQAAGSKPATSAPVATTDKASKDPGGPTAQSLSAPVKDADHVSRKPVKLKDRAPLAASKDALRRDYDAPAADKSSHPAPSMETKARAKAKAAGITPAADCEVEDFTSRTGAALVKQVKSVTTDCVNTLFDLHGEDAHLAFKESQMVTIANAMRDGSATYPGDSSTGMPQLVLYLRAGYYVQYNDSAVGEYGPRLVTAIQGALDAFFDSPHAYDVSDANGETLAEAVILIDSSEENANHLDVVKKLLADYDSSYDSSWYMLNAVNSVYTVTFRGHQLPEFVSAVEADPSLLKALSTFATDHLDLLGGEQAYLTSNAGRELGRFLQHDSLREKVRPMASKLLNESSITGRTAALWVGVAEMTDYYDQDNCSYYDTCNLAERLKEAVLPIEHTCSDSITILAQDMSSTQLKDTCTSLNGQDAYFHDIAKDDGPVADDHNDTIEVVVFDSSDDYQTYAGAIYGIDTNNGGMYLEGDPAAEGNQPRFVAYEADWEPTFQVWNLNHEYTHYLDGRFDMYGDFEASTSTPTIWWVEGFAEYVSYSYRDVADNEAIAEAGKHTYSLRDLFDTDYKADETRTYDWGYLAVRYMLESHRDDIDTVLDHYRTGDWNAARNYLTTSIGDSYDNDWNSWLTSCAAGSCATSDGPSTS